MKEFIQSKNIPNTEPVIVAGDLNIDNISTPEKFKDVTSKLNLICRTKPIYPFCQLLKSEFMMRLPTPLHPQNPKNLLKIPINPLINLLVPSRDTEGH